MTRCQSGETEQVSDAVGEVAAGIQATTEATTQTRAAAQSLGVQADESS